MRFPRNVWYAAAHAHELDEGLVARTICNEPVVMFRKADGEVAALADRCPHRFVPLSMGRREGDTIRCGYHGLAFDASGSCSDAPNDDEKARQRICVKAYVATVRYAIVWLWMGEAAAADPAKIPAFDFLVDKKYAVARGYSYIKSSHEMLADNLLDLSHVHYLHPGVHARSRFTDFTNKVKVEGDTVWSMLYRHHYHLDKHQRELMGLDAADVEGQGHSRWDAPSVLLVDAAFWEHGKSLEEPGHARSPSAHLLTPETAVTTHYFWGSGRTFRIDDEDLTSTIEERNHVIFETQDAPMCEAQQKVLGASTDFLSHQPIILKADAAGVAARRIMRRKRKEEASLEVIGP